MPPHRLCLALLAPMALLAGCDRHEVAVDHAWVRLPAVPGRPAAAYFTLHGGARDAALTGVASTAATRAEMHETMASGTMSTMKPIASVALPAGADVRFAPGGRHVMLFGIAGVQPGGTVPLSLSVSGQPPITVSAAAVAAGSPPPTGD